MNKTATTEQIVVEPYRVSGSWVFDFPPAGVIAQPFARGIPEMLDMVLLFLLNFFFPEPPQKLYFRVEHIEE
ncbi:MAG: hypothetical protein IID06_04885 [Gemmatimonadetes bacterium]|nr:hypothetical protein [Gemmatimonadota bacterium]